MAGNVPIGVELVRRGIVKEEDIDQALEYQRDHPGKKLCDILNILKLCPERDLLRGMGEVLNEKVVLLTENTLKISVAEYISLDICRSSKAIPFEVKSGRIKVAFADTSDKRALDQVRLILLSRGLVMDKYLTFEENINNIIKKLEGKTGADIRQSSDISTLVDTIIKTAMQKRASDIHIEPMESAIRVRYRVDGDLITVANIDKANQSQIIGRLKAISNMHQEIQDDQDGRITLYNDFNIRVSSQKTVNGEKFVLRLLKKNAGIQSIFDLGFPNDKTILERSFNKRNSITVIAAPTGEGKTTTLYSVLDYLNKPEINITTVEDPVEIRVQSINQIEIDGKTTFAGALRTILRQDPDIILLGEIRDLETAEIALQAGQTGHYVLSTIHTINAVEVITRLRKLGISDYDIASTLANAISQRLVRKVCPNCAEKRPFTEKEKEIINKLGAKYGEKFDFTNKFTYTPKGCKECNFTGFYGRIACFEILEITDKIREMLSEGQSSIAIRNEAVKEGYRPLYIDALGKVVNGITTLDEANRKLVLF